jgi:hypothetical protein
MAEFNDYMTPEERAAYSQQLAEIHKKWAQERWQKGEAGQLCDQLYQAYSAYTEYLERNYSEQCDVKYVETVSQQMYLRLRENLEKAREADRCTHIKPNGSGCGSPRMKDAELCYAHTRMAETKPQKLSLPSLEDANGVQLAIMKLVQWLIDDQVDPKKAGMISYLIQTAANNVKKVDFELDFEDEDFEDEQLAS